MPLCRFFPRSISRLWLFSYLRSLFNDTIAMDTGLTERPQPVGAGELVLLGQPKGETDVSSDVCAVKNEQQEAVEPISSRRPHEGNETCSVDSHGLQNALDKQGRLEELRRPNFHILRSILDAQREKINEQLQELHKVVVLQCRITGTNPLAQEMAAVVLGKRVGKKFGDSLTPKALKCLYNVFSIKDTITKKEAREISMLCGATVTQVREFFAGQRSRVRKVVLSSHIEQGSDPLCPRTQSIQLEQPPLVGSHSGENVPLSCSQQVPGNEGSHLVLLETFRGKPDGILSKLYAVEKAEHLINVMHKESTFTGQSQLAQVIMQAHDSVLRCFIARGGLQQIIRWLIQAAAEEQTSLIRLILKAITQFPLGSALPRHMSLLLQTVNKLRFYRAQDVASRARLLLSRWSRFCKSTQNGKLGISTGIARSSQPGQKRSRDCAHTSTVDDASKKKAKAGSVAVESGQMPDVVSSSLTEDKSVQERQKPETVTEINNTRKRLGSFSIQGDRAKEKRKVQLFEETRAPTRRRDLEVTKSSNFDSPSRPLSADDIKKAKIRAYFLNNSKAEKPSSSKLDGSMTLDLSTVSFERGKKRISGSFGHCIGRQEISARESCLGGACSSIEKGLHEPTVKCEITPKVCDDFPGQCTGAAPAVDAKAKAAQDLHIQSHESAESQMLNESELSAGGFIMDVEQSERCAEENAMDMIPSIPWTLPPGIALDPRWKIAMGEHSTEIRSETRRLSTVLEATYPSPHCIPSNPAEPAERICLFVDDTLVPEILLEAVDEESLERDCSLQSPRDAEPAEVHGGETDCQNLDTHTDVNASKDIPNSSILGISGSNGLEMVIEDAQLSRIEDNQVSSGSVTAHSDGIKPAEKVNGITDAVKNVCVFPSKVTPATSLYQACAEARRIEFPYTEAYEQAYNTAFVQPRNLEGNSVFKDQTTVVASSTIKASSTLEPSVKEEVSSGAQIDRDCLKETDQVASPSSDNNNSGVDLSELSKETCLDMLNIVLQQLADNAKGSGADLELLSVFLKNPQLVYSLMSSQSESLGQGLPMTFTGSNLGEIISSSTIGSLGNQLEELVGRNIGQVANSVRELARAGCYTGEIRQPVITPPITVGPQSHPLLASSVPRPLAAIEPAIQLPSNQSKVIDATQQYLRHPSIQEHSSSRSLDYDWSQPYDYPTGCMQQGTGLARHSAHSSSTIDRSSTTNTYSQPTGYTQAYVARASQLPSSILQTDQRVQSSIPMHIGGLGQLTTSMMHAERQEERATSRRNGFCAVDVPTTQLLPNSLVSRAAGISDGLLPAPDMPVNNHRVHPSKVIHESHSLHGGPAFSPLSHAPVGHQVSGKSQPVETSIISL
ncbi:hypothetical protein GOP47_0000621 [Adiantum capillus-veneris]|uniref:Homeobox domain-containing protein n=1 Tax=Adiantum capillus-veneris TaxID=13818 RepID=A0A9D4VDW0_ADICA|nr:hypothetical protein GOP47_0000621 [Adiantum capillus-veneris]